MHLNSYLLQITDTKLQCSLLKLLSECRSIEFIEEALIQIAVLLLQMD